MPARRKSPPRRTSRTSTTASGSTLIEHAQPKPVALWEAFEAARAGGYRGMWFLPELDTSRQMQQYTRDQIAGKNVWAYNNIGEIRAIIDGLALDEVDTALWPTATTSNKAFNKAVTDRFHEENKDARSFDLRQVENFYTGQFLIRRSVRLHGDLFGQLVRPEDIPAEQNQNSHVRISPPPRLGFLPGYQCKCDSKSTDPNYRDGIRQHPKTKAALQYTFAVKGADGKESFVPLDASNVLHFHDPFLADQIRGISTLAPVTTRIFTMDDIDRAESTGQVIRSRQAYAIETTGEDTGGAPTIRMPGEKSREVIENADGSKTIVRHIVSYDGSEADVVTPPTGAKIKVLESSRAGALEYRNSLARTIALPSLYPPDWVLFLIGLRQGTDVRMLQNRVQKVARFFRGNQLESQYCDRYYTFWLWKRIQAGVFDKVAGGVPVDDWFMREWNHPADLSVDTARDGRINDDRVDRGRMSPRDYSAKQGRHYSDVDDEVIEIAYERREKLKAAAARHTDVEALTFNDVFLPPQGSPGTAGATAPAASNGNNASGDPSTVPVP